MCSLKYSRNISSFLFSFNSVFSFCADSSSSNFALQSSTLDIRILLSASNFALAIKEARKYEKNQDKLIIVAGACQSNYELLIKSGANFASSPKRINIHALDPAIIASKMSLSPVDIDIDLKEMLEELYFTSTGNESEYLFYKATIGDDVFIFPSEWGALPFGFIDASEDSAYYTFTNWGIWKIDTEKLSLDKFILLSFEL